MTVPLHEIFAVSRDDMSTPEEQFEFLRWLFGLEPDATGESILGPDVSSFADSTGRIYVLQGSRGKSLASMRGLCRTIDGLSGRHVAPGPLESWFDSRRVELQEAGIAPLFTREVESGR